MRCFWLKQLAVVATVCCGTVAYSQQVEDFDFATMQLEVNYAGFPSVADTAGYRTLKERLRSEVVNNQCKGYMAAAELVGWFGDCHLWLGDRDKSLSLPYLRHRKPTTKADGYAPQYTAKKIDPQLFLIRIPSFDETKSQVDSAVAAYRASGCPYLVVDVRGNGGGQDGSYRSLRSLLYDRPGSVDGAELRNTPEHRAYFKQSFSPRFDALVAAMEQSDSVFYPLTARQWTITYDSIEEYPKKAALIIDDQVASSGEQFMLETRASSGRTTIYGRDNTLGCLDLSNVRRVELPSKEAHIYVPMSRSYRLPNRGIDRTGIAPDVRITLPYPKQLTDNLDPWVIWVAKELKR